MTFSDLIDPHSTAEPLATEADATGTESAQSSLAVDPSDTATEKRVALPKPDINNITVLTESLPNDPILPWHHFDSPWLEKEETPTEDRLEDLASPPAPADEGGEQLVLALDQPLTPDPDHGTPHRSDADRPDNLAQSDACSP